jgi:hypothetical protein
MWAIGVFPASGLERAGTRSHPAGSRDAALSVVSISRNTLNSSASGPTSLNRGRVPFLVSHHHVPAERGPRRPLVGVTNEGFQVRVDVEGDVLDVGVDLHPRATRVIDQNRSRAVIGGKVADADVLAIAPVVGER